MIPRPGAAPPTATPFPTPTATATTTPPPNLGDILESVTQATVLIETLEKAGTGFFISDDIILTNAHVFDQDDVGSPFVLRNKFNEKIETVLVYRGVLADVAVLQRVSLPHGGPETTTIPKGATARLGDRVFVVGFPTRSLQAAAPTIVVTAGIVSATPFLQGLKFSNEEPRPMRWVQTDTPFNPGNSGGPLVNERGEVVGIVTWKFVGATIDGLNMALPIDTALSVIPRSIYDPDAQ